MSQHFKIEQPAEGDRNASVKADGDPARNVLSSHAHELAVAHKRNASSQSDAASAQRLSASPTGFLALNDARQRNSATASEVVRTYRYADGTTITEHANGDSVKASREGHKVTTKADGTMIFQDNDGRVNMIVAKDGTITQLDHKKGTRTTEYTDGTVLIEERDGTRTKLNRAKVRANGASKRQ